MTSPQIIIYLLASFALAFLFALFFFHRKGKISLLEAKKQAEETINEAKAEKESLSKRTKEQIKLFNQRLDDFSNKTERQRKKLEANIVLIENRLKHKEDINKKEEEEISVENQLLLKEQKEIEEIESQKIPVLEKVAKAKSENLKDELLVEMDNDLQTSKELRINKLVDHIKENDKLIATNMLIEAIHRYSAPTSVDKKSLTIPINRTETKAKIIGKDCQFLTMLEDELGVDLLFDEARGGVIVTHFELVKRHIARETVLKMLKEKQLSPEGVIKLINETTDETNKHLKELGDKIVRKLQLEHRHFPDEFKEILGKLKYRTSYGQNILKHCFEVGFFTLLIGNELGLNQEICKIGGFFHDIGKAIDQEDGRPHDVLTKEIMEKFGIFSWEEIHAAWTHHDAVPIETAEALLVKAGDAISAGRPGARQETIEKYLARVMALEEIGKSYEGVKKVYAISGGRELRVIVDPKQMVDDTLPELAHEIAHEIEEEVAYPGQIRVNVIRRIQHKRVIKSKNKKEEKKK